MYNNKEIEVLANKIAEIVIKRIEERQDEMEQEFNEKVEQMTAEGFDVKTTVVSNKEVFMSILGDLQKALEKAIDEEDYQLASLINSKIDQIKLDIDESDV